MARRIYRAAYRRARALWEAKPHLPDLPAFEPDVPDRALERLETWGIEAERAEGQPAASGGTADRVAEALADLPETEREAVAEHVRVLARLSPRRRAAILALTDDERA